jgi:hypothetical protein
MQDAVHLTGDGAPLDEARAAAPAQQQQRPGLMAAAQQGAAPPDADSPTLPTPEEQKLYDLTVTNGLKLMAAPKSIPAILRLLEGEGDPVEGLAQAASSVVMRLVTSLAQAGKRITPEVTYHASVELFEELADMSTRAGIHDFREDADGLQTALLRAISMTGQWMKSVGLVNEQQGAAEMAAFEQADQSGELEQKLRTLIERERGGGRGTAEPQQRRGMMPGAQQQEVL